MKRQKLFSERYGYKKPSDVMITCEITEIIDNGICTCLDLLRSRIIGMEVANGYSYDDLAIYVWVHYLKNRLGNYSFRGSNYDIIIVTYYNSQWFEKLDLIEFIIDFLYSQNDTEHALEVADSFVKDLNDYLEELNFGYRVIDKLIVPVSDKGEIKTIETAIERAEDNVKMHLHSALEELSKRPNADYRNSIKESISAVEALCRNISGKDSLKESFGYFEAHGLQIPDSLRSAFNVLYGYTNDKNTGIRHPLMTDDKYAPTSDEAIFMLVVCSAFINYLKKKVAKLEIGK